MRALLNWLDHRTGYRHVVRDALYENIPGGARWRFITGSMLVFAFFTQMVTGLFLWMCYSPSSTTAWESVYYIQNEMQGGWLLRGVHHFMAQAMVVLLVLHMLQVVWDKAYKAPREINYWLGLVLMLITLALSLTGYLLPWDQKGYWATKVATNLMTLAPQGEDMQKLAVGGRDYGHMTLTRFFALHAGLLPLLLIGFLALHLAMFRRHGITAHSSDRRPDQHFWPHQVLKDGLGCLLLLAVVLLLVLGSDVLGVATGSLGDTTELGAHLGPPADSAEEYKAARPEWYFLFLFQMLKYFGPQSEVIGAIGIPALVLLFLFLMPLWGRFKWGHRFNVVALLALIASCIGLTVLALHEDHYARLSGEFDPQKYDDPVKQSIYRDKYTASHDYWEAREQAELEYDRVKELAEFYGIPREGAVALQRNDPETMGPRLFRRHCASCHSYTSPDGEGIQGPPPSEDGSPNGGPNLYNFGSREWLAGLLDPERIISRDYFGGTSHAQTDEDGNYPDGRMVAYVHSLGELDEEGQGKLEAIVAALSAEAQLVYQADADQAAAEAGQIEAGKEALAEYLGGADYSCLDCHEFHGGGAGFGAAPDLTGWGSGEWIKGMIHDPAAERFYSYDPGNDRMPAFQGVLTDHEIEMLTRFIRGDDRDLQAKLEFQQRAPQPGE